ncbi:ABC transporter permease [Nonomuraea sp. NPDC050153]|uniref:ABC transporter permease n=1 Tax=Nonomuraea sp. NPDC050153 TaxID=3364359 RepID=UPI0037B1D612
MTTRLDRLATTCSLSVRVAERNVAALRGGSWIILLTGFFEPLFYLLAIGVGLGAAIGPITPADARTVGYAEFVGPAMVASYAMSSALAETTFVFVGRLRYLRVYDAILATPVRPVEIALGELGWATVRVVIYAAGFLVIMTAMELTTPMRALAALPAATLAALAFGALGIVAATLVRDWRDFDAMALVQFGMFMFSATFTPIDSYPIALQWLVQATPLYHAVTLIRSITIGAADWSHLVNAAYLIAVVAIALAVASSRINRLLRA